MAIRKYTLKELLEAKVCDSPAIVEGWLWEQDNAMFLGPAKVGKSLWCMELAFNISSGTSFLGFYNVPKPRNVLYLQGEGKISSTINRTQRMNKKISCDPNKVIWFYAPSFPMDRPDSAQVLIDELGDFRPEVIFYDPLYKLVSTGSLSQDDVSNRVTQTLDTLKMHYNCANVIAHHEHKIRRTSEGKIIFEGDDAIFGSFIWKAWPDNVLLIQHIDRKKKIRRVSCNTQREGDMEAEIVIQLNENPLHHTIIDGDTNTTDLAIITYLSKYKEGSIVAIQKFTDIARSTVANGLKRLMGKGLVAKNKNKCYHLTGAKDEEKK